MPTPINSDIESIVISNKEVWRTRRRPMETTPYMIKTPQMKSFATLDKAQRKYVAHLADRWQVKP